MNLFRESDHFSTKVFSHLEQALRKIYPQTAGQRRELPKACRELSNRLTADRDQLEQPYWTSPRMTGAYLYYFLPWNLVRLSSLLPSLDFGKIPENPIILDVGSGPLTIPIALWMSRPDLRKRPVTIICTDKSPQILKLGKELFYELRKELDPNSPWTVRTLRCALPQVMQEVHGDPWLLTLGNVLNELDHKKGHFESTMEKFCQDIHSTLCEDSHIFAVEPGTRQGSRLLSIFRKNLEWQNESGPDFEEDFDDDDFDDNFDSFGDNRFDDDNFERKDFNENRFDENKFENDDFHEERFHKKDLRKDSSHDENSQEDNDTCQNLEENDDFHVQAPCPHTRSCPLGNNYGKAWCHFNAYLERTPKFLKNISQLAGLDKISVSLSFFHFAKQQPLFHNDKARIISDAFPIPGYRGRARYACHHTGLLLVLDSSYLKSGEMCDVYIPRRYEIDRKSSATICTLGKEYEDLRIFN